MLLCKMLAKYFVSGLRTNKDEQNLDSDLVFFPHCSNPEWKGARGNQQPSAAARHLASTSTQPERPEEGDHDGTAAGGTRWNTAG